MENPHANDDANRVQAYLSVLGAVRQEAVTSTNDLLKSSSAQELTRVKLQMARLYNRVERHVLQDLVDATPVRRADLARERLEQQAIEAVLSGTEWLTGDEVGLRFNPGAKNRHSAVSRWLAEGKVFAIDRRGQRLFARYEFDEAWQPLPVISAVLQALKGYSPFRVAGWFESTNANLNGLRPREALRTDPESVITAARHHAAGPTHG